MSACGYSIDGDDEGDREGLSEEEDQASESVAEAGAAINDANVQPAPGTPGTWGSGGKGPTFFTKRDNPVPQLSTPLRKVTAGGVTYAQSAQRVGDVGATNLYRLTVETLGAGDLEVLSTANWGPSGVFGTVTALHEAHGALLRPGFPEPVTLYRDDWDTPEYSEGTSHFQLDATTHLVPVRVMVFYPDPTTLPQGISCPSAGSPYCESAGRLPLESSEVTFDDNWIIDIDATSSPDVSPKKISMNTIWASQCLGTGSDCQAPVSDQPDDIFEPCNNQFRQIDFRTCKVPFNVFANNYPAANGGCSPTADVTALRQAANACAGAGKAGLINVVYMGTLINHREGCSSGGVQLQVYGIESGNLSDASGAYVFVTEDGRRDDLVLSHEIGHAMGHSAHSGSMGNLMYGDNIHDGPALTASQCSLMYLTTQVSTGYWPAP